MLKSLIWCASKPKKKNFNTILERWKREEQYKMCFSSLDHICLFLSDYTYITYTEVFS